MSEGDLSPIFAHADAYEKFMGRWSRRCGKGFLGWLALPRGLRWLDVGCGTGALTDCILESCAPSEVAAVDPATAHVEFARARAQNGQAQGGRARFEISDGCALPFADGTFDAAVSGLVLNFIADRAAAVREMRRVVRPSGTVASYVWDFAERNDVPQHFWAALALTDPMSAARAAETVNAASTHPDALARLFADAGLQRVETRPIEIDVAFADFDDYWSSNTCFPSPVGRYAASLSGETLARFQRSVRDFLPNSGNGRIEFRARAWAVRGARP